MAKIPARSRDFFRFLRREGRAAAGLAVFTGLVIAGASPAAAAVLSGTVRFEGTPPVPPTIYMTLDDVCDKLSPKGRPSEALVVDAGGGLANVIVHVKSGLPDKTRWETTAAAARIDQKACMYSPHVIAVMVGQEVEIHNSDPAFHNVSARTSANPPFSVATPAQDVAVRRSFLQPELPVKLKCDVHPWMSAFVGVFAHPFFAVSAADGSFVLPVLPEGDYTIEAWHETLGVRTATVSLDDDEPAKVEFSFAGN